VPNDIDAEDWLDNWTAGVSAQAERAAALSRRVAALTASAESADGSVRVRIGSAGHLESLELADRALARRIMAVLRRAQSTLAGQVETEVEQTVGADTETGRAVIHSFGTRFPPPDEGTDDDR
jgi:hypothetical protein